MAVTHSTLSNSLASGRTGRDHYHETYKHELEKEAEWLRRGAPAKADSVQRLVSLNEISLQRILELGCGTGAVLSELKQRGMAESYFGVDYSEDAIAYLTQYDPDIRCATADITKTTHLFEDIDDFDLVVISHVIEHLEQPRSFLESVNGLNFKYLVAEVPLEDLLFGRVKALIKDRSHNRAGHVQFYHRGSFKNLLTEAGFEIIDEHLYPPILDEASLRFAYEGQSKRLQFQKKLTERVLPQLLNPVWSRYYHGHYAVLCKKQL